MKPEVLETYNYPYETHHVTTQDGYILTVYRVTGSPNTDVGRQNGTIKPAVYLQHGLGAASDNWNFQPGSRNLREILLNSRKPSKLSIVLLFFFTNWLDIFYSIQVGR